MNSLPTLYLRQTSQPVGDRIENAFRKFCPSPKGVVTVQFSENKLEISNSGYGKELDSLTVPKHRNQILQQIIDPKEKLKALINAGKIARYSGNAPVHEAQVIFLDDKCHGDKEQALVRGEIANALKGGNNILLCEGFGTETMYFSEEVFNQAFAPNLDYDLKTSFTAGWDDSITHKASLEKIRSGIEDAEQLKDFCENSIQRLTTNLQSIQISPAALNSPDDFLKTMGFDLGTLSRLVTSVSKVQEATGKDAHIRTTSAWDAIQKFRVMFPDSKIFIFGGAGHNNEPWMLEQLKNDGLKYCILTPVQYQEITKENALDYAKQYYRV